MQSEGPGPDDPLGAAGEAEWERQKRLIELSDAFWLGFVFSPSPRSVIVLRERVERLLRTQTKSLVLMRPETPDALRGVLPLLLEKPETVDAGCTWVEAVRADSPGAAEQPWTAAWEELFMRTNERRDWLRSRLRGGLVFATAPAIKPRIWEAAPDLWAVRTIVMELPAVVSAGGPSSLPMVRIEPREGTLPAPDPDFNFAEAERRDAQGAVAPAAQAYMQAARGFLAQRRADEGREASIKARELLRGARSAGEAEALALLAEAEEAGDPAAAADHIHQAVMLMRRVDALRVPFRWFDIAGRLARARSDFADARAVYDQAVTNFAQRVTEGETPETLRDLAVAFERLGNVERELGEAASSERSYESSLELERRRRNLSGDTPEVLRELSMVLEGLGNLRRESGDIVRATAAYEESLALRRKLRERQGDAPDVLLDLSIALSRLGNVRRESGDLAAAKAAYEESLASCRKLRETQGDTPEVLRALSVALNKEGDTRQRSGDLLRAAAAYDESMALCRRLQEIHGETPEVLRRLSIALINLGDVRRAGGDPAAARAAYEESITYCRRLATVRKDGRAAADDLAFALDRMASVRRELGDVVVADAAREESLALRRQVGGPENQRLPPVPVSSVSGRSW